VVDECEQEREGDEGEQDPDRDADPGDELAAFGAFAPDGAQDEQAVREDPDEAPCDDLVEPVGQEPRQSSRRELIRDEGEDDDGERESESSDRDEGTATTESSSRAAPASPPNAKPVVESPTARSTSRSTNASAA